ncbi:amidase [Paenibacillus mucilaginosus 3016]|uniref:Amidase n=1 Tax=Paenibacillus mucilaginosus 3016 TaxID=1116391 RepID=H6NAA6_9BACL|nr:amidase family protein [Paenibacillus mucilaginosus]AFC29352.1 amidase [Paenibacillus mucilaginosus 3016]WFA18068.1 amidase [Paenibacillus mucilaginosus]
MMHHSTQKKKRLTSLLAGTLLLAAPLSAHAAQPGLSLSPDEAVLQAAPLSSEGSGLPGTAPMASVELAGLLRQAAELAGKSAAFPLPAGDAVTRKDTAAALSEALQLSPAAEPYTDVPDDSPYTSVVGAVYKLGLMNGYGAAWFGADDPLTREQAYTVANRVYGYLKPFELVEASIPDMQTAMAQGKLTSEGLVQMYLDRIAKYDKQGVSLNSMISLNSEALELAKALDEERRSQGPRGPLHGIPIIVKDNYDTEDMATTAGCLCLKDSMPGKDADQVAKLKAAGAIILGKSNLSEFAFNITTTSSLGGQTLNPYALQFNPGGSSGGTGASIAANFAAAGMGTDTGGSIRVPSAFNSLVGIRPTVGLSSRDGIIPLALTQDVGGPMARSVTDAAILLDATAGYDPDDTATAFGVGRIPASYTSFLDADGLKGARIGVAVELIGSEPQQKAVSDLVYKAVDDLERLGAQTVPILIPHAAEIGKYPSLSGYEFKFHLNDYLKELGPKAPYATLNDIIESGRYIKTQEEPMKARNARESLDTQEYKDIVLFRTKLTQESLLKVMADHDLDAIVYPTSAYPAAPIGEPQNSGPNTKFSPFSGFPAVTVPAGFTPDGLPVGLEFLGRAFDEGHLIQLAYAYEQGTQHRKPPVLLP